MQDGPEQRVVRAAVEALGDTLAVARALVGAGREVDLEGLDRGAARVCAAVMALPLNEARVLLPALEEVLRQLDAMAASIGPP
jgi:hypothetical protein